MLLAIDPGLNASGWALFDCHLLQRCGLARVTGKGRNAERVAAMAHAVADCYRGDEALAVVIEQPQHYQQRYSKGDPQDLAMLSLLCGSILAEVRAHSQRLVYPREWKGTIPKRTKLDDYIVHKRNVAGLRRHERNRYTAGLETAPRSLRHNIADAVGIGLWAIETAS
jgi:hypothetical protein